MGIIRLLLAIAVVFAHSPYNDGVMLVGGRNAVQMFYVISGFLISYILTTSDRYRSVTKFYASRALRIYPVYFVVAIFSLLIFLPTNDIFLQVYRNLDAVGVGALVVSNMALFGQDWVMFLGTEGGRTVFTPAFYRSEILVYHGLLVPQAWTLGVELSFYLLAPFIMRRRKLIWALLAASLALRLVLLMLGVGFVDPWTYRFFPTELALFLIGALTQQILLPLWLCVTAKTGPGIEILATALLVLATLVYFAVPLGEIRKSVLLFAIFVPFLPLAFLFQNRFGWDKAVGNLSYPIYVGHYIVIYCLKLAFPGGMFESALLVSLVNVAASLLFAMLLDRWVARPFEKVRSSVKGEARTEPVVTPTGIEPVFQP